MKQRHGCLTAWLILMLIANSATALLYLFTADAIRRNLPHQPPSWLFPLLIVFALFNVVCAIALWQWKKWGFWGFLFSSIVALFANISAGLGAGTALLGLLGIAILYAALQIGNENKGWPQLE
jgi:hypothetical protein